MATMGSGPAVPEGPGVPTPPEVLSTLVQAFGAQVGETGYEIAAAKCTSEAEKAEARERGSSLLYGELLPDGVSKVLQPTRLGGSLANGEGKVLELGMGSGKVALQFFLQCRGASHIMGIELLRSRFEIAEAALLQLVAGLPGAFRICSHSPGENICVEELASQRRAEFRCADFFSLGLDLCGRTDAIVFAVNIPCRLFPKLCEHFAGAKEGCRLFSYHSLDTIWWVDEPCPFRQCEVNVPETDLFATSWSPQGYRFYVYVCDRSCEPQIRSSPRNETFSEWQAVWDEASKSYYYHNQETEQSQWEIPHQAGCWQSIWCQEHGLYFFCHWPSGHVQWEVPKCMADLGWDGAGTAVGIAGSEGASAA